jgi:hypothetical protein
MSTKTIHALSPSKQNRSLDDKNVWLRSQHTIGQRQECRAIDDDKNAASRLHNLLDSLFVELVHGVDC